MNNLNHNRYASLVTYRKNGTGVPTPVWFVQSDQTHNVFYCFSAADAGKVKRIRNSTKSDVAACDMRGGSLQASHPCHAYIVTSPDESTKAYNLLIKKYGWQMRITNLMSTLSGRINNRAVIRFELISP